MTRAILSEILKFSGFVNLHKNLAKRKFYDLKNNILHLQKPMSFIFNYL